MRTPSGQDAPSAIHWRMVSISAAEGLGPAGGMVPAFMVV